MSMYHYITENDDLTLFNLKSKWITRFLSLAMDVSSWSKDPSSKVGAIIVNSDKKVIGLGYNGLSREYASVDEHEILNNRDMKYPRIIHAEPNCIDNTEQKLTSDDVMFITHQPCVGCINKITQNGIKKVIFRYDENVAQRFNFQDTIDELNRLEVDYHYFTDFEYTSIPQNVLAQWCEGVFGELYHDREERIMRFIEEAIELAQAEDLSKDMLHNMVEHVYSREADKPENEIGGVTVTWMCYLSSTGYCINNVALDEYNNKLKHITPEDMKQRHQRKVDGGFGKQY